MPSEGPSFLPASVLLNTLLPFLTRVPPPATGYGTPGFDRYPSRAGRTGMCATRLGRPSVRPSIAAVWQNTWVERCIDTYSHRALTR